MSAIITPRILRGVPHARNLLVLGWWSVEADVAHGEAGDEAEQRGAAGARWGARAVLGLAAAFGFGLAEVSSGN